MIRRNCVFGESLVNWVVLVKTLSISCTGGADATLGSNNVFKEFVNFGVQKLVIMGGTI